MKDNSRDDLVPQKINYQGKGLQGEVLRKLQDCQKFENNKK
jgi:hypothetical protein